MKVKTKPKMVEAKTLKGVFGSLRFWHRDEKLHQLHQLLNIYVVVFLIWGVYRLLFRMPEWIEETFLKGVVFGLPVLVTVLRKEKIQLKDLGMHTNGLVLSLYFGWLFGMWLAVFGNALKFLAIGKIGINPEITVRQFGDLMLLGLVTAFWEQLLFSGYLLPRFKKLIPNETVAVSIVSIMFALIHIPVQLSTGATPAEIGVRFLLLLSLGFGCSTLYLRFKNLAAPIFAHLAWGSVIYLFG